MAVRWIFALGPAPARAEPGHQALTLPHLQPYTEHRDYILHSNQTPAYTPHWGEQPPLTPGRPPIHGCQPTRHLIDTHPPTWGTPVSTARI